MSSLSSATVRAASLSSVAAGRSFKLQATVSSSARFPSARRMATVRAEAEAKTTEAEPAAAPAPSVEIQAPADFVAPEPRRFQFGADQFLDIATASLPVLLRLGTGVLTANYSAKIDQAANVPPEQYSFGTVFGRDLVETSSFPKRPAQPIILYEFEGCPFCRKVREAVSVLDLDVLYYPCPQGGPTFRPKAIAEGGKKQFPYMIDPNTGVSMYESNDIIKYLVDTYGDGTVPLMLRLGTVTDLTAGLSMILRVAKGSRYTPARMPSQPLELWAYEPSPFCKIVREVLVELELPHIYHSTPRGSIKRSELKQRTGTFQVPYLEDPNTGVKTFESKAIIEYLRKTYALPSAA